MSIQEVGRSLSPYHTDSKKEGYDSQFIPGAPPTEEEKMRRIKLERDQNKPSSPFWRSFSRMGDLPEVSQPPSLPLPILHPADAFLVENRQVASAWRCPELGRWDYSIVWFPHVKFQSQDIERATRTDLLINRFGYDQGVLSALLTLDTFQENLPLMTPREQANDICWLDAENTIPNPEACTGTPNTQAAGVAIYQIGCFLGALLILFYGEKWGRRSSTFW